MDPHRKRASGTSKKEIIATALLLVGIVGGGLGMMAIFSEEEGEECEGSAWGCARGLLCVDEGKTSRCRVECETNDDCESGRCRRLIVIGSDDAQRACR